MTEEDFSQLVKVLDSATPEELSEFLGGLSDEELKKACRGFSPDETADFLVKLDENVSLKERIISLLKDNELDKVMDEMSVEDTVDMVEDLPAGVARRIAEEDEILRLLQERNFTVLKPLLREFNPTDLAEIFDEVPKEEVVLIFRILPKDLAAETFVEMSGDSKEALIRSLNDIELKAVMDELFLDDTAYYRAVGRRNSRLYKRAAEIPQRQRRQHNDNRVRVADEFDDRFRSFRAHTQNGRGQGNNLHHVRHRREEKAYRHSVGKGFAARFP